MSDNAEKAKHSEVSESSSTERRASEVGKTEVDQELPTWMAKKQQADEQFRAAGLLDKPRDNFVSGTIGRLQIEGDNGEILVKGIPAKGQERQENPVDTQSELSLKALGENDPKAQAMYEVRKGIKTHMPEGQARDHALSIARQTENELFQKYEPLDEMMTASDSLTTITPDIVASSDHFEGQVTHVALHENKPIGWLEAAQKLAQIPFDKQLQVIGAGLRSGINEYNHQQQERYIGALIGTVQGVGTIATNLAKVTDFTAALIKGDKEAANQGAAEFGEALGSTIVGGVRLFEGAHHYLNDVGKAGYEGDYTKVFRDIDNLGKHLDKAWSNLPPREQARIISKLGTELAADGLIGLGTAKTAGKLPGQFTKIMDTVANDAQRLHQTGKNITQKSVRALEEAIDPVVQGVRQKFGPRWADATAYDGEFNAGVHGVEDISKGAMVLEKRKFASKLDPKVRLTPIEAAREHANLNGKQFDEKEWKKLSPDQKSDRLTKECNYTEFTEYDKPVNRRAVDAELDLIRKEKISPLDPVEAQKTVDRLREAVQYEEGNVAIAQIHIDGKTDSMASINGLTSPDGTIPAPKERHFEIDPKYGGRIDHSNDSEVKILEAIASQINRNSIGGIYLFSERKPCGSCLKVVQQFREQYPDVKVHITYNPKKGGMKPLK